MGSCTRAYTVYDEHYELYARRRLGRYQLVALDGGVLTPELLAAEPTDAEAATLTRQLRDGSSSGAYSPPTRRSSARASGARKFGDSLEECLGGLQVRRRDVEARKQRLVDRLASREPGYRAVRQVDHRIEQTQDFDQLCDGAPKVVAQDWTSPAA